MVEPFLSCGIVLARSTDDGWMTLLLRAYYHWDFPKGLREEGEDSIEAALREVREETGIADVVFEWAIPKPAPTAAARRPAITSAGPPRKPWSWGPRPRRVCRSTTSGAGSVSTRHTI